MENLLWFLIAFLLCLIIKLLFVKPGASPTPAGAIIMANGIFLYSAMQQFPLLYKYGEVFAFILAAVWSLITISILMTLRDRSFRKLYLNNPIDIFAIGTWVAGTSVLGNVIFQFSLNPGIFPYVMGTLNVALYCWYVYHLFYAFRSIVNSPAKNKVHGALLLATVGTQSIVLLLYNIFNHLLPDIGSAAIIGFGIFLYVAGFVLIVRRFAFIRNWNLADDWNNTNCILHGAISISGLAAATTGSLPYSTIFILWIWVLFWFILVEALELARVIVRTRKYGIKKAIFTYDVSQWSRNFTFGMLYAFTAKFPLADASLLHPARTFILTVGPWVVFLFLIYETFLFAKDRMNWKTINKLGVVQKAR